MSDEMKIFNAGELVFAKLRGYPPWPAMIINYRNQRYKVIFFGTKDWAYINRENVSSYLKDKEKFVSKHRKCAGYLKAVKEIELALKDQKIEDNSNDGAVVLDMNPKSTLGQTGAAANTNGNGCQIMPNSYLDELPSTSSAALARERQIEETKKMLQQPKDLNMLIAFLPGYKCLIKVGEGKPEHFDSFEQERHWDEHAYQDALLLKMLLEVGYVECSEVRNSIIVISEPDCVPEHLAARLEQLITENEINCGAERELLNCAHQIQVCLGLRIANLGHCLAILNKVKALPLKRITLLRNPEIVDMVQRLRYYVGNLHEWNLDGERLRAFKQEAEMIRQEGAFIYCKMKSVLQLEGVTFWSAFEKAVSNFRTAVENLSIRKVRLLTDETYDKLLEYQKQQAERNELIAYHL